MRGTRALTKLMSQVEQTLETVLESPAAKRILNTDLVKRAQERATTAVLALSDAVERVSELPRGREALREAAKAVRKRAPISGQKRKRATAAAKRATAAPAKKTTAKRRRMPDQIKTTGGHGLSGDVARRAVKGSAGGGFKAKKGKRS